MIVKIRSFYELARLDKPIGIYLLLWPSLLGLLLGGLEAGSVNFKNYLIVIIGSILVRSCGCVINDISDYKFDKLVKRTAARPLATGALNIKEALVFFFILGLMSLCLLLFTNSLTIKIALFFALLIMFYPMTKRFIKAPQFILGITFGSGTLISYSLESNAFSPSILVLYFGVIAWVISFDTFYALEDIDDDKKIGIYSTPILWGRNTIFIARILQYLFYISLAIIGFINKFSIFFILVITTLLLLDYVQMKYVKNKSFLEVFKFNNWIGIVAIFGFLIEIFII
jgi:4-hydroxybenzoate polyprenyltransferase